MKLNHFNNETLPKQMGRGKKLPKASFGKSGTISFNGAAVELMDFKQGEKISIAQDEEDDGNWYFFKDPKGFELRQGYDKKGSLFNHAVMVKTFIESFSLPADITHAFLIAGEPTTVKGDKTKYWGVLVTPR
jgi:hypothetical protein